MPGESQPCSSVGEEEAVKSDIDSLSKLCCLKQGWLIRMMMHAAFLGRVIIKLGTRNIIQHATQKPEWLNKYTDKKTLRRSLVNQGITSAKQYGLDGHSNSSIYST